MFALLSPAVNLQGALLRRQPDGTWRIALEAEAPMPPLWFLVAVAGVLLGTGAVLGWLVARWRMRRTLWRRMPLWHGGEQLPTQYRPAGDPFTGGRHTANPL